MNEKNSLEQIQNEIDINYSPHPKQWRFHLSKAKFRLICSGVGFGKTVSGVNELLKLALQSPGGCMFAMVTPTYRMLKTSTLREFFKFCPKELIKKYNRSDQTITLINNVEIVCVTGDDERSVDRIRGMTLAGAYGDEIALCPEYIHDILVARLRDSRGPLRVWYTTTPKGFTWIHRVFIEKKKKNGEMIGNSEDYELFGGTTWDNPYTLHEYKNAMVNIYSGTFAKQELEGQFVGYEGLVYPSFSREKHIVKNKGLNIKRLIGGVDWGYTNPMVYLLIGIDSDDKLYVLDEFYESKMQVEQFAEAIRNINLKALQNWKESVIQVDTIWADPSEPQFIAKLRNMGLNVLEADNEIMPGINRVFSLLDSTYDEPRLFICENCVQTINEFQLYRYPDTRDGRPQQENPLKVFDHAMDALRYCVTGFLGIVQNIPKASFGHFKKKGILKTGRDPTVGEHFLRDRQKKRFSFSMPEKPDESLKKETELLKFVQRISNGLRVCQYRGKIVKPVFCFGCKEFPECEIHSDIKKECANKGFSEDDVWKKQEVYKNVS